MTAMIFWALSFVWYKIANEAYRPLTIVYFRVIISAILLSLFLFSTRRFEKIRKEDRKYFLLLAFLEPFLYFLGESFGLTYVTSTTGSVLIATIPLFAAIGGWIFFHEKLKLINYFGIIISVTGVMIFVLNRDGTISFDPRGLALLSLAVLSAVGYSLVLRKLTENYNPVFIVNIQNVIGAVFFLPLFLMFEMKHMIDLPINTRSLTAIIELAIFASCGAFILFGFAVKKLGVTKANVFTNLIPILTALFAFFMIGEVLSLQKAAGMIIVITGLFLSQIKRKQKRQNGTILAGKTA